MNRLRRLVLGIAVILWSRSARAEEAAEWSVREALVLTPGRCLARDALADAIAGALRRDGVDARLRIVVSESDDEVSIDIERRGQSVGQRTLPVRDLRCETSLALVGFAAAAAIDATAIAASPSPPPPVLAGREPEPSAPPPAIAEPRVTPSAFVETTALAGLVRGVSFGAEAGAQLRILRRVDVRLAALGTLSRSVPLGPGSAEVQLLAGELLGCGVLHASVLVVRPCLGSWAGRFHVEGDGFPESTATNLPFVALLARADAAFRLAPRWSVLLFVTGWASLTVADVEAETLHGRSAYSARLPTLGVAEGAGVSFDF